MSDSKDGIIVVLSSPSGAGKTTLVKKISSQIKIIALLAIPVFLISFQPDLGSAIIFIAFFFPLFREGLSYIYLIVFVSATLLFLITIRALNDPCFPSSTEKGIKMPSNSNAGRW